MTRPGFDNEKYVKLQSENIRRRISQFGGKLYLEFGGKLFDDFHASRVLPGFKPDTKVQMLLEMKDELNIPEFGGPWFCRTGQPGVVTVNMSRTSGNAIDNRDYVKAECILREDSFRMARILKENFEEFRNSYLIAVSLQAGIRESRRIKGIHTVTADEYVNAFRYHDSIARGAHPIDIHVASGPAQNITFLKTPAYVPYRALMAPTHPNLLVAGRCLSADKTAFASLRVQASCMDMGQAAGTAAAIAAGGNTSVQDVDIAVLIERLRALGSVI